MGDASRGDTLTLDIGDLVRWKEPMGGPPFFIQGSETFTMSESYLGIIYDITYDGTSSILSYMVRWSNGVIFPVFINEIVLVAKGGQ
jgi:fermentation-respiration switch protein FrsA (DUF1100 family)